MHTRKKLMIENQWEVIKPTGFYFDKQQNISLFNRYAWMTYRKSSRKPKPRGKKLKSYLAYKSLMFAMYKRDEEITKERMKFIQPIADNFSNRISKKIIDEMLDLREKDETN
ncbi:hypothetical protein COB55_03180 [Candidatus Wolfebacteria bacterium]|nr:MAG: hypothetical protein COB55_03180 [Candidatus Wolfebacteria bacterium]